MDNIIITFMQLVLAQSHYVGGDLDAGEDKPRGVTWGDSERDRSGGRGSIGQYRGEGWWVSWMPRAKLGHHLTWKPTNWDSEER